MVQTEVQYVFIHHAIMEYLQTGETEIPANQLRGYIKKKLMSDNESGEWNHRIILDRSGHTLTRVKEAFFEFLFIKHQPHFHDSHDYRILTDINSKLRLLYYQRQQSSLLITIGTLSS